MLRLPLLLVANVFLNSKREKEEDKNETNKQNKKKKKIKDKRKKDRNPKTNLGNVAGDTRMSLSNLPLFVDLFQTNFWRTPRECQISQESHH